MAEPQLSSAWAKRRDRLSRHIEEASLRRIVEQGVEGVTVDDLAQAAEISRRTFYRYFPTPMAVLAALPRRSLDRLVSAFAARPLTEGIATAFLRSLHDADFSPQESVIRTLSEEVLRRSPDAWRSAVSGLQAESVSRYREVISHRLAALDQDASHAGALAATFSTVIVQVNMENRKAGGLREENLEMYRAAFRALSIFLGDC